MKENIILICAVIVIGIVVGYLILLPAKECANGHTEKQLVLPPSIVVGGSRYGGGIAIPTGNVIEEDVFVCDEYK